MTAGELDPSDQQDLELARTVGRLAWEGGGSEAFWTLWEKHRDWVWLSVLRASRRSCPPFVERKVFAEALLERVLLRLTQKVHKYRGKGPFRGFLKQVVVNAAIDQGRHYDARREGARPDNAPDPPDTDADDDGPTKPGPTYRTRTYPSPERLALAKERSEILYEALRLVVSENGASVNWAAALRLFYLEGLGGPAIAEELGCTAAAVHQYLTRGRKELRSVLGKRFGIRKIEDLIA